MTNDLIAMEIAPVADCGSQMAEVKIGCGDTISKSAPGI
jgi:hypothetical protein